MQKILADEISAHTQEADTVLIKATASWCGPCKMYNPVLDQYSDETATPVYEVDIEENPDFAAEHKIMAVPTLFVYRSGRLSDVIGGAKPLAVLKELLGKNAHFYKNDKAPGHLNRCT